jgi:SulP family sulfate permease
MRARALRPDWLANYHRAWLRADLLAGVTITAYLVPQVMAYAELAGLPAAAGLWAAMGALAGYALAGSSPQLSVGPESTTALMTAAVIGAMTTSERGPSAAALALVVCAACLAGWVARVSVLADLLSRPVLVGYMAGIAMLMIVSQLGKLTRLDVPDQAMVGRIAFVARHLGDVHVPTLALAGTTLVAMLVGSARYPRAPVALLGMLGATAASAILDLPGRSVQRVGDIPGGLPVPGLPNLDLGSVPDLVMPALGVAFVGFTDNVLTARAFATRHGDRIDARRELLGLGLANLGAGMMHGFPVSSSGSRTAIGDAVGARSKLTGLSTLVVTVVAVLAMRPLLEEFPAPALGAVVVYAALRLVEPAEFRRFATFRRAELVIALVTAAAVIAVGVLQAVLVAIGLSILDLLRRVARPHDAIQGYVPGLAGMHDVDDYPDAEVVPGLIVYRYDSPLFFANAEDFRARALAAVDAATTPVRWFLLNTEAIVEVDITAVDALESLRQELVGRGIVMALARVKQDLRDELAPTGLLDRIGEDHVFPTLPTAVAAFREGTTGDPTA